MKVLLSIKPEFAERIFDGTKRYEFRKAVYTNRAVRTIVVYVTRPVGRIVGEFDVEGITEATPDCLWATTQVHAGITREFFDAYFSGRDRAFAIRIGTVRPSFRLADTRKWRKSRKNGLNRAKNVAM